MSKAVIYYSLTGNTKEAAKEIARKLGAKLFEIDLAKPLPRKPAAKMLVGGMQSTFGRTPKIKGVPDNIDYYDEIILGMPIWAGLPAAPVNTFIKKYSVADRINAVFTFSGSGVSDNDIGSIDIIWKYGMGGYAAEDGEEKMCPCAYRGVLRRAG